MKIFFKTILSTSIIMFLLVLTVFADTYHGRVDFVISASSIQSDAETWSPAFNIPSGNLYINTYANLANPTGMTEYYTVSPKATAPTVGKIKIDGNLHTKTSSMAAVGGVNYGAKAYKWDNYLYIKVTGRIYFYSTNNS